MKKISAILPLKMSGRHYADNVARCDILFSSLRAFAPPDIFDRFVMVVPHDEVAAARRYAVAWQDFRVEIVDESGPFAVFAEYGARHQIRNWHRQQIIKLAAPELLDTEYFLVFDPDCFATRPFTLETLLPGGKALTHEQPRSLEARYWQDSAATLQLEPHVERDGIWMTPAILSRTLCQSLHQRLEEIHGKPWMNVLLERYMINWTEYTLYWLNAEAQGLLAQFHTLPGPGQASLHTAESVWYAGRGGANLDLWDAEKYFSGGEGSGIFAVIQSNTGLDVQTIAEKLRPYMPITLQPYERHRSRGLKAAELYSAVIRRVIGKARKVTGGAS
jgi:hypothetical protein